MTSATRWCVKHSVLYHTPMGRVLFPGKAWLAYTKYGGCVIPGSAFYFGSWCDAMDYVNGCIARRAKT